MQVSRAVFLQVETTLACVRDYLKDVAGLPLLLVLYAVVSAAHLTIPILYGMISHIPTTQLRGITLVCLPIWVATMQISGNS